MPTVEELARLNGGAIQVDIAKERPLMAVLAGPIAHWWKPGLWDSAAHKEYTKWRDAVEYAFISRGWLVYSPHKAWRGSWHEDAQHINDTAIMMCDMLVVLTPPGVEAIGTEKVTDLAKRLNKLVFHCPPGDVGMTAAMAKINQR